jgi:Na+-translocating ferredoxin:NAD+ oxidoreductase RNF subunit RnfB
MTVPPVLAIAGSSCTIVEGVWPYGARETMTNKAEIKDKIKRIYDVLPKLDDQRCGFKTCGEFARAVAEGRAPCYGCVSGGLPVAEKVCQIVGAEVPVDMRQAQVGPQPVELPRSEGGMGRGRGLRRGGRVMGRAGPGVGRGFGGRVRRGRRRR